MPAGLGQPHRSWPCPSPRCYVVVEKTAWGEECTSDQLRDMLRVLLISTFGYTVVAVLSWVYRRRRPNDCGFDTAMAAGMSAWTAVVVLSGTEHLFPGALAVALLALAHSVLAYTFGRGTGAGPILLLYQSEFSDRALEAAGLSRHRILSHLRERGIDLSSPENVLILEPSGEVRLYRIGSAAGLGTFRSGRDGDPRRN